MDDLIRKFYNSFIFETILPKDRNFHGNFFDEFIALHQDKVNAIFQINEFELYHDILNKQNIDTTKYIPSVGGDKKISIGNEKNGNHYMNLAIYNNKQSDEETCDLYFCSSGFIKTFKPIEKFDGYEYGIFKINDIPIKIANLVGNRLLYKNTNGGAGSDNPIVGLVLCTLNYHLITNSYPASIIADGIKNNSYKFPMQLGNNFQLYNWLMMIYVLNIVLNPKYKDFTTDKINTILLPKFDNLVNNLKLLALETYLNSVTNGENGFEYYQYEATYNIWKSLIEKITNPTNSNILEIILSIENKFLHFYENSNNLNVDVIKSEKIIEKVLLSNKINKISLPSSDSEQIIQQFLELKPEVDDLLDSFNNLIRMLEIILKFKKYNLQIIILLNVYQKKIVNFTSRLTIDTLSIYFRSIDKIIILDELIQIYLNLMTEMKNDVQVLFHYPFNIHFIPILVSNAIICYNFHNILYSFKIESISSTSFVDNEMNNITYYLGLMILTESNHNLAEQLLTILKKSDLINFKIKFRYVTSNTGKGTINGVSSPITFTSITNNNELNENGINNQITFNLDDNQKSLFEFNYKIDQYLRFYYVTYLHFQSVLVLKNQNKTFNSKIKIPILKRQTIYEELNNILHYEAVITRSSIKQFIVKNNASYYNRLKTAFPNHYINKLIENLLEFCDLNNNQIIEKYTNKLNHLTNLTESVTHKSIDDQYNHIEYITHLTRGENMDFTFFCDEYPIPKPFTPINFDDNDPSEYEIDILQNISNYHILYNNTLINKFINSHLDRHVYNILDNISMVYTVHCDTNYKFGDNSIIYVQIPTDMRIIQSLTCNNLLDDYVNMRNSLKHPSIGYGNVIYPVNNMYPILNINYRQHLIDNKYINSDTVLNSTSTYVKYSGIIDETTLLESINNENNEYVLSYLVVLYICFFGYSDKLLTDNIINKDNDFFILLVSLLKLIHNQTKIEPNIFEILHKFAVLINYELNSSVSKIYIYDLENSFGIYHILIEFMSQLMEVGTIKIGDIFNVYNYQISKIVPNSEIEFSNKVSLINTDFEISKSIDSTSYKLVQCKVNSDGLINCPSLKKLYQFEGDMILKTIYVKQNTGKIMYPISSSDNCVKFDINYSAKYNMILNYNIFYYKTEHPMLNPIKPHLINYKPNFQQYSDFTNYNCIDFDDSLIKIQTGWGQITKNESKISCQCMGIIYELVNFNLIIKDTDIYQRIYLLVFFMVQHYIIPNNLELVMFFNNQRSEFLLITNTLNDYWIIKISGDYEHLKIDHMVIGVKNETYTITDYSLIKLPFYQKMYILNTNNVYYTQNNSNYLIFYSLNGFNQLELYTNGFIECVPTNDTPFLYFLNCLANNKNYNLIHIFKTIKPWIVKNLDYLIERYKNRLYPIQEALFKENLFLHYYLQELNSIPKFNSIYYDIPKQSGLQENAIIAYDSLINKPLFYLQYGLVFEPNVYQTIRSFNIDYNGIDFAKSIDNALSIKGSVSFENQADISYVDNQLVLSTINNIKLFDEDEIDKSHLPDETDSSSIDECMNEIVFKYGVNWIHKLIYNKTTVLDLYKINQKTNLSSIWKNQQFPFLRSYLLFEFFFHHSIREDQYKIHHKIVTSIFEKKQLFNFIMGAGKSSVISPLVTLTIKWLLPESQIFNVMPSSLVRQSLCKFFLPTVNHLYFDIGVFDSMQIKGILDSEFRIINIMSSDFLKLYRLECARSNKPNTINNMSNSIMIHDEIDELLDASKSQLNIPFCDYLEEVNTINVIYYLIYNICIKYSLINNLPALSNNVFNLKLDEIQFLDELIDKFNSIKLNRLPFDSSETTVSKWKNRCVEIMYNLKKEYKILKRYRFSVNFGFQNRYDDSELSNKSIFIAMPYKAVDSPIDGSEFSNVYQTIWFTFYSYIYLFNSNNVRNIDIYQYYHGLYLNQLKSYKISGYSDIENPIYIELVKMGISSMCREIENFEFEPKNRDILLHNMNFHKYIQYLLTKFVGKNLYLYNISYCDIIHSGLTVYRTGFSGTTNFDIPVEENKKNEILNSIDDPYKKNVENVILKNHPFDLTGDNKKPIFYLDNLEIKSICDLVNLNISHNKISVLIDSGAYFVDTIDKIVDKINEYLDVFYTKIVYFDKFDRPMIYDRSDVQHIHILDYYDISYMDNVFYFYDNKHIVGQDLKINETAKGFITIGFNSNLTDVSQGMYRMRKIETTQTCYIVAPESLKTVINDNAYEYLLSKSIDYKNSNKVLFTQQNLLACLRYNYLKTHNSYSVDSDDFECNEQNTINSLFYHNVYIIPNVKSNITKDNIGQNINWVLGQELIKIVDLNTTSLEYLRIMSNTLKNSSANSSITIQTNVNTDVQQEVSSEINQEHQISTILNKLFENLYSNYFIDGDRDNSIYSFINKNTFKNSNSLHVFNDLNIRVVPLIYGVSTGQKFFLTKKTSYIIILGPNLEYKSLTILDKSTESLILNGYYNVVDPYVMFMLNGDILTCSKNIKLGKLQFINVDFNWYYIIVKIYLSIEMNVRLVNNLDIIYLYLFNEKYCSYKTLSEIINLCTSISTDDISTISDQNDILQILEHIMIDVVNKFNGIDLSDILLKNKLAELINMFKGNVMIPGSNFINQKIKHKNPVIGTICKY